MNNKNNMVKNEKSRRNFLKIATTSVVAGAVGSQGLIAVSSLLTPVSRDAQHRWKLGKPDNFEEGITFIEEAKTFVIRDGQTFKALSAVCTHLGCVLKKVQLTNESESETGMATEFHCPCHSSKFTVSGERIAGPARKSLQHMQIVLSLDDKQLLVDLSNPVEADYSLHVT